MLITTCSPPAVSAGLKLKQQQKTTAINMHQTTDFCVIYTYVNGCNFATYVRVHSPQITEIIEAFAHVKANEPPAKGVADAGLTRVWKTQQAIKEQLMPPLELFSPRQTLVAFYRHGPSVDSPTSTPFSWPTLSPPPPPHFAGPVPHNPSASGRQGRHRIHPILLQHETA